MNILITGTDGFIGSYLKEYFESKGYNVIGTVFFREAGEKEYHVDFTDLKDFNVLPEENFDIVIHTVGIVDQTQCWDRI
jgi:nucleoside-diphosphate-sugar epimerase